MHPISSAVNEANVAELLRSVDLVVDCSDHAPTKYLLNDTCIKWVSLTLLRVWGSGLVIVYW